MKISQLRESRFSLQVLFNKILRFISHMAILIAVCLLFSSCGYLSRRKGVFDAEEKEKILSVGSASNQTLQGEVVSRREYEELQAKYDMLLTQMATQELVTEENALGGQDLVSQLGRAQREELVETVDVFSSPVNKPRTDTLVSIDGLAHASLKDDEIEHQISQVRKAEKFLEEGKFNESLAIIKNGLDISPVPQIKVKAMYLKGELLFQQNEFDLAMQIFEEIITRHAYSGLVVKALGRLIVCAEKLKLDKQKDRYYAILRELFETT